MTQIKVSSETVKQQMGVFQCEKKLKMLADEYHTLLNRKAMHQEKQHTQAVKSVVSEACTSGMERITKVLSN